MESHTFQNIIFIEISESTFKFLFQIENQVYIILLSAGLWLARLLK